MFQIVFAHCLLIGVKKEKESYMYEQFWTGFEGVYLMYVTHNFDI